LVSLEELPLKLGDVVVDAGWGGIVFKTWDSFDGCIDFVIAVDCFCGFAVKKQSTADGFG
jgi:hypothetical protein